MTSEYRSSHGDEGPVHPATTVEDVPKVGRKRKITAKISHPMKEQSVTKEVLASTNKGKIFDGGSSNYLSRNKVQEEVEVVAALMGPEEESSDLKELFEKCRGNDTIFYKLALGMGTIEEFKVLVNTMGRCVLNLGSGLTLLHLAAQFGREDWLVYLVEEGHHPLEVKSMYGETPLDQAAWKGHVTTAVLLLKFGANIDCQTNNGYTPLHRCAYYNHQRLAGLFVMAGANQRVCDENQQTAYHVAKQANHDEITSLLTPVMNAQGRDITDTMYAANNPTHPHYHKASSDAFFHLFAMEHSLQQQEDAIGKLNTPLRPAQSNSK